MSKIEDLKKLFKQYDPDAYEEFIKVAKKKGFTDLDIKEFNKSMEKEPMKLKENQNIEKDMSRKLFANMYNNDNLAMEKTFNKIIANKTREIIDNRKQEIQKNNKEQFS